MLIHTAELTERSGLPTPEGSDGINAERRGATPTYANRLNGERKAPAKDC